jgi:hypothetical protein
MYPQFIGVTAEEKRPEDIGNQQKQAYVCGKCDKDAMISEIGTLPEGGHRMKAGHFDGGIADHTWKEYDLALGGIEKPTHEAAIKMTEPSLKKHKRVITVQQKQAEQIDEQEEEYGKFEIEPENYLIEDLHEYNNSLLTQIVKLLDQKVKNYDMALKAEYKHTADLEQENKRLKKGMLDFDKELKRCNLI